MSKYKGIPDYEKKKVFLYKKQVGRCAVTGALLVHGNKIDLHHLLADSKVNRKLYKLYVSSVWNLALCYNDAHVTKALPKHPPEWKIRLAEGLLASHPGIEYRMDMEEALQKYCVEFMR